MKIVDSTEVEAVVLLSGGIDSACCAYMLTQQGYKVSGMFVDFGQASRTPEREFSKAITERLGISLKVVDVASEKAFETGEILGRNAFLAFTALVHSPPNIKLIAMGLHAGTPYYDCSQVFLDRIDTLVKECSSGSVSMIAPFINWQKNDVYEYFKASGIPLNQTYSCERGTIPACGTCNSCKDRGMIEC
ncbi:7-cyano-7-deazaguanine synthase [uncultured Sulfitobacter sp.]|uniref:7-cyano-7-deazaguanine synthase n=1 Tax=uncultured Sulfitobacter sp. TaxID=191468 RepID=UPI002596EED3|nr:7-cyano-7-deazaguanine synthase [uncultured Sulfitobacter sp.]